MSPERRILWGVIVCVALVLIVLLSSERVEREIAPEPKAAWIAIEVDGSGLARTGRVELSSGTPFRLHAVLEAETWSGKSVYFTEADRLQIDSREIPPASVRRWQRAVEPRILWFTVEGYTPYLEIDGADDLDRFRFQELFRPDWPRTWSIPGDLRPRSDRALRQLPLEDSPAFGTQRFHVRIEIFGPNSDISPRARIRSLGADDLPAQASAFPTVVATLPGALEVPSRVFGLAQIEPTPRSLASVADRLDLWARQGLAFSRLAVLRDLLERSNTSYAQLEWTDIDLAEGPVWGSSGVSPGDLLRVGNRWLVLLRDAGTERLLDRDDLCLDFDRGARVRRIGEVFTGDGLIEWSNVPAPRRATAG